MTGLGKGWLTYIGAWGLVLVYYTTWDYFAWHQPLDRLLVMNITQCAVYALLGIPIILLALRYPIDASPKKAWRRWLLHFGTTTVMAALGIIAALVISTAFDAVLPFDEALQKALPYMGQFFMKYYHTLLLFMWVVLAGIHGFLLWRRLKDGELKSAILESRLVQAQNLALRTQLQPHFLFNALNAVSALIHSEPDAADRMLSRIGDLLRLSLERPPDQTVSLRDELDLVERYLAIERIRFGDRLLIHVEVPKDVLNLKVPSFILQPLLENALRNGFADRTEGGRIWIRAFREGADLVLHVQDDGHPLKERPEGIEIQGTRIRLELLYKGRHALSIAHQPGTGTLSALRLPAVPTEET